MHGTFRAVIMCEVKKNGYIRACQSSMHASRILFLPHSARAVFQNFQQLNQIRSREYNDFSQRAVVPLSTPYPSEYPHYSVLIIGLLVLSHLGFSHNLLNRSSLKIEVSSFFSCSGSPMSHRKSRRIAK